jgi:hypothetical protein
MSDVDGNEVDAGYEEDNEEDWPGEEDYRAWADELRQEEWEPL